MEGKHYRRIAIFVGGTLFGSAGIKLLASKDAKKVYEHTTAAVLRAKDAVMDTVANVQECASDILASAKDINESRVEADEFMEDASETVEEIKEIVEEAVEEN